ncbi:MAG TPA: aminotransferase class V-fold PLP-dependent enzyme [Bryobacteraceae bacterium]|nr:aminotransferase class V-fold PLP-dependent enzyme [Bryobacteraceae bacterium]
MTPDWDRIRGRYPGLRDRTFLNTATFGMLSERSVEAVNRHFTRRDETACGDFLDWFDDLDQTRAKVARLIHASPDDIAFSVNSAVALSLFLGGIDWKPGDRIVALTNEFPNQIYYAALLKDRGVEFVEVEWPLFFDAITPNTRAVLMSQVSYSTGFRPPIAQIGPFLRSRGVLFYLDATQALGALTIDVNVVQPSMLAVHGYKWLLCPNGAAFFYVSPELRRHLAPNVVGWRSHEGWRNVSQLHAGAPVFSTTAEKYEGGMPAFPCLYALDAAVEDLLEIGPEQIEARVLSLTEYLHQTLHAWGPVEILHGDSPITVARFPGVDAASLAVRLKERGILVSARHGGLRLSLHFYNGEMDVEKLVDGLREL